MSAINWLLVWEATLTLAVILSTAVTLLIFTLPTSYSHFHPHEQRETDFTEADKTTSPEASGYAYFRTHSHHGVLKQDASVQVVVLGDIGRSPRMQNHALSIATHGGHVDLIGYTDSEIHPALRAHRSITIIPIPSFPLPPPTNTLTFLLLAPLKLAWQLQSLYHALGYLTAPTKWLLVQNPPSIPLLLVAQTIAFVRNTRLVIDWHNLGFSLLALRLGTHHPLVTLASWHEGRCARAATAHFAVTDAMCRVLASRWNIKAVALHDRPAAHFQPLTKEQRLAFLRTRPELQSGRDFDLETRSWRLLVSPTSWTEDEDFALLLDALSLYATARRTDPVLPELRAVITGKGPLQAHYKTLIATMTANGELHGITITTAWLSTTDYAALLASADLGISLHTSSSGVDLPMKVVDMFGAGLPVAGWSRFEAWPELVTEGVNGRGFGSAGELAGILQGLFGREGGELEGLRAGAVEEGGRRWGGEWGAVAGELFRLRG
ncbi:hypothetical protein LTR08_003783 [Meristemomyces frigidus]|nr:hypothetical protein LTR08_003783 [Meristemomyces frigidus]